MSAYDPKRTWLRSRLGATNGTILDPKSDILFYTRCGPRVVEAMRRREFITLIGSLSVVWPSVVRGQQAQKLPLVGVLMPFEKGDEEAERRQSAFQNGLAQFGWRNGQNIRIEYRWAGGDPNRYQSHAADLVGLAPDVIIATATPVLAAVRASNPPQSYLTQKRHPMESPSFNK